MDPPHPVIVTIMDNTDDIRVLLYSYYTPIAGWGVLLRNTEQPQENHAEKAFSFSRDGRSDRQRNHLGREAGVFRINCCLMGW